MVSGHPTADDVAELETRKNRKPQMTHLAPAPAPVPAPGQ